MNMWSIIFAWSPLEVVYQRVKFGHLILALACSISHKGTNWFFKILIHRIVQIRSFYHVLHPHSATVFKSLKLTFVTHIAGWRLLIHMQVVWIGKFRVFLWSKSWARIIASKIVSSACIHYFFNDLVHFISFFIVLPVNLILHLL